MDGKNEVNYDMQDLSMDGNMDVKREIRRFSRTAYAGAVVLLLLEAMISNPLYSIWNIFLNCDHLFLVSYCVLAGASASFYFIFTLSMFESRFQKILSVKLFEIVSFRLRGGLMILSLLFLLVVCGYVKHFVIS